MRISRMSMAVLTGALVLAAWLGLYLAQRALFPGLTDSRYAGWIAFGVGLAALWLKERFDVVAPALTPPLVDLYAKDPPRPELPAAREWVDLETPSPREREKVGR
jgi:hypothetical protein